MLILFCSCTGRRYDSAKIERYTPGEGLPTTHLFCGVQSYSKRAQVYSRWGGSQALGKCG